MLTKQISGVFCTVLPRVSLLFLQSNFSYIFSNFFPLANTFQYFIIFPLPFAYRLFPDLRLALLLPFLSYSPWFSAHRISGNDSGHNST